MNIELSQEAGLAFVLGGFLLFIVIISLPTWIHDWREHRKARKTAQLH